MGAERNVGHRNGDAAVTLLPRRSIGPHDGQSWASIVSFSYHFSLFICHHDHRAYVNIKMVAEVQGLLDVVQKGT